MKDQKRVHFRFYLATPLFYEFILDCLQKGLAHLPKDLYWDVLFLEEAEAEHIGPYLTGYFIVDLDRVPLFCQALVELNLGELYLDKQVPLPKGELLPYRELFRQHSATDAFRQQIPKEAGLAAFLKKYEKRYLLTNLEYNPVLLQKNIKYKQHS